MKVNPNMKVSLKDIEMARERLRNIIRPTELDYSLNGSKSFGVELYLKHENSQRTGSFKIRGAYNKVISLTSEEKKRGVVASSAGNHAQGVALSSQLAGVQSTIVMPTTAPLTKVAATKSYGAEVILHGDIYDEAYLKAKEIAENQGKIFVHPYEDPLVIAGQGTIGLEIFEQVKDLDSIIVAVGGGGLISGVATAIKSLKSKIKIIGVQSERASSMVEMFRHQAPKEVSRIYTIADGIAVKKPSQIMFDHFISTSVDEMVTVSDEQVAGAMVWLLERTKNMVEGAGAAPMAALMNGVIDHRMLGQKTCVLLSGGNVDLNVISKVIEKRQINQGRLADLSVVVEDAPGTLYRLTKIIADEKANILQVHHDRVEQGLILREARVDFLLETMDQAHIERIKIALKKAGAKV